MRPVDRVDTLAWSPPKSTGAVSVRYGAASGVGAGHVTNEDSFLVAPPVFLVADGMGGHSAGDVASRMVADRFASLVMAEPVSVQMIRECIAQCQAEVGALVEGDGPQPGSTLVVAAIIEHDGHGQWLIANVGDSRAYRWAEGQLRQISHDHSVVQELIDAGRLDSEQAKRHPERNVITRAIGIAHDGADYSLMPVSPGSRLLLCSDGVSSVLDDGELERILAETDDAGDAARRLVSAAHAAGGVDDATAVVVDVVPLEATARTSVGSQAEIDTVPSGGGT